MLPCLRRCVREMRASLKKNVLEGETELPCKRYMTTCPRELFNYVKSNQDEIYKLVSNNVVWIENRF